MKTKRKIEEKLKELNKILIKEGNKLPKKKLSALLTTIYTLEWVLK